MGVFLSADTVQGNLHGMNPYAYVGNNPEARTDPTGEMYAPGTGGEGGPSGKQLQNDANAYTHHTTPAGGYLNSTLPPLLYMFLYNHRAWGSLEGNAENHGSSFLPTLSEQALSYLHFTSDVNWNASGDLQALYAQLVSLSVLHLVQISGETGLEGAMDLVGVEAAIDRLATEGGGAFTANAEGDNGVAGEEGNGTTSGEEGGCSFTATTQVATNHGKQAIGTLEVGEMVWAYNPKTQKMELQPILHVFLDRDNDLVDLTLTTPVHAPHSSVVTKKSEVIHTNKKHPFYTLEKGFLSVGQISIGMHVLRADGRIGVVTGWKIVPGATTMYNLEVAHDHTFTVGLGEWVVHNCGSANNTSGVVDVQLSRSSYPETTQHIEDAINAGQPDTLTLDNVPANIQARRATSLRGYPPKSGFDRDEYPPAIALEGGAGADIRYVGPSDNRGAGASMSNQLRGYPVGTRFRFVIVP